MAFLIVPSPLGAEPQVSPAARPAGHAHDAVCESAATHPGTCHCACGGARHGITHVPGARAVGAARFAARSARVGGVFATVPTTGDDDEWWVA
jgi:hypothetical protein